LDHVPERYQAAWRSLLSQCPALVGPFVWEAAKHDAAILFGDFGRLLGEYQWAPGDLFDKSGGLVWFIKGSPVTAIGHSMAQTQDGRIWLRARQ
jgi:hypothetical protein